jgi:hypothetical protein
MQTKPISATAPYEYIHKIKLVDLGIHKSNLLEGVLSPIVNQTGVIEEAEVNTLKESFKPAILNYFKEWIGEKVKISDDSRYFGSELQAHVINTENELVRLLTDGQSHKTGSMLIFDSEKSIILHFPALDLDLTVDHDECIILPVSITYRFYLQTSISKPLYFLSMSSTQQY